jgi:hypothetical protein
VPGASAYVLAGMASHEPHADLHGWWRIVETSQWVNDRLDVLGPALISITGYADRLRMQSLLAYVNTKPTKTGASFTWEGAWEYDPMSGTGSVKLGKDGKLHGRIKIKGGDESTFLAERAAEPAEPIPSPPKLPRQMATSLVARGSALLLHAATDGGHDLDSIGVDDADLMLTGEERRDANV